MIVCDMFEGDDVAIAWAQHDVYGDALATVPELPGCMSDGETPMEALVNVGDAIATWIYTAGRAGRSVPQPNRAHV